MKKLRALAVIAAAAAAALVMSGCSMESTEPDEAGLHYSAGPLSATSFADCIPPGKRVTNGPSDKYFLYPYGSRTYTFDSGSKSKDTDSIQVVSQDNVELTVRGSLSFRLDTDCKTLRAFHEAIGIKYGAGDSGVAQWGALLDDYLGNPLKQAMSDAAQQFPWQGLYNDPAIKKAWEEAVKKALPDYVKNFARGDYFGSFTLSVPKPQPPQALIDQLNAQQVANQQVQTFDAQAQAQAAKIQQIKDLVAVMGPYGYVLYQAQQECAGGNQNACKQFLPVPAGTNVNVTPGG